MNETNITNQNEVMDEFDLELQRSAERHTGGQKANGRGKHLGLLLMRATGAESAKGRSDNLAAINGVPVRFHSADGKHFSLNPKTEAPSLIFATYKGKPTADKPLHCRIYGLRLAECLKAGKRAKSGSTERVSVSLALVGKRIRLGNAFFPSKFIEAESPDHWMDLEGAIAKLTGAELETMMDAATREKIRAFVLVGCEEPAPAAVSVFSSPVDEVAQTAKPIPGEPEAPVTESAPAVGQEPPDPASALELDQAAGEETV
jgi:hypothetical protein